MGEYDKRKKNMSIKSSNNSLFSRSNNSLNVYSDSSDRVPSTLGFSSSESSSSKYTAPSAPTLRPSPSPTAMLPLLDLSVMTTAIPDDPKSIIQPRPVTFANLLEVRRLNS